MGPWYNTGICEQGWWWHQSCQLGRIEQIDVALEIPHLWFPAEPNGEKEDGALLPDMELMSAASVKIEAFFRPT